MHGWPAAAAIVVVVAAGVAVAAAAVAEGARGPATGARTRAAASGEGGPSGPCSTGEATPVPQSSSTLTAVAYEAAAAHMLGLALLARLLQVFVAANRARHALVAQEMAELCDLLQRSFRRGRVDPESAAAAVERQVGGWPWYRVLLGARLLSADAEVGGAYGGWCNAGSSLRQQQQQQ